MKVVYRLILVVLVLLALLSGAAKVMLAEQEVGFFGKFGISEQMLIAFGCTQLLGGLLMILPMARVVGAAIVAVTFLASLAVLMLDGSLAVAAINAVALLMLGVVIWTTVRARSS